MRKVHKSYDRTKSGNINVTKKKELGTKIKEYAIIHVSKKHTTLFSSGNLQICADYATGQQ